MAALHPSMGVSRDFPLDPKYLTPKIGTDDETTRLRLIDPAHDNCDRVREHHKLSHTR